MTEKWKIALKEFLKKYEEDDDGIGAVLCGSYANETYNENSDIDVYLILKDGTNYSVRGNTESNSYLIEYFMNTKDGIKEFMAKEFNNGKHSTTTMFAYGKIIYDLNGTVKELQDLALDYLDRPFKNITTKKLDENNYQVCDLLDELNDNTNLKNNVPYIDIVNLQSIINVLEKQLDRQKDNNLKM